MPKTDFVNSLRLFIQPFFYLNLFLQISAILLNSETLMIYLVISFGFGIRRVTYGHKKDS